MVVTYKYRIYPNKEQQIQLAKTFGCVRFVWNFFLAWREKRYREEGLSTTESECRKHLNNVLKKQFPWLREVDKFALENALINLDIQKIFQKANQTSKIQKKEITSLFIHNKLHK